MNLQKPTVVLILVSLITGSLQGGVIPGRWEKLDGLESGSKVVLTSKGGDRMRLTFKQSDSTSLIVRDRDGRELIIPKSYVAKIVKENPRNSKPAWICAAVAGGAMALMGAASKPEEGPLGKPEVAALMLGLFGAAVGFTAGYLIVENPPDELLYEYSARSSLQSPYRSRE